MIFVLSVCVFVIVGGCLWGCVCGCVCSCFDWLVLGRTFGSCSPNTGLDGNIMITLHIERNWSFDAGFEIVVVVYNEFFII